VFGIKKLGRELRRLNRVLRGIHNDTTGIRHYVQRVEERMDGNFLEADAGYYEERLQLSDEAIEDIVDRVRKDLGRRDIELVAITPVNNAYIFTPEENEEPEAPSPEEGIQNTGDSDE